MEFRIKWKFIVAFCISYSGCFLLIFYFFVKFMHHFSVSKYRKCISSIEPVQRSCYLKEFQLTKSRRISNILLRIPYIQSSHEHPTDIDVWFETHQSPGNNFKSPNYSQMHAPALPPTIIARMSFFFVITDDDFIVGFQNVENFIHL